MDNLLKDLEQYLIAAGIGMADSIDMFRDFVPDSPDFIVALSEYQGAPMAYGDESVSRSVQVIVRAKTYDQAHDVSWQVFHTLIDPLEQIKTFSDARYGIFHARQTPRKLQVDGKARVLFFFNMGIITMMD